jgi:hypothetical protein
MKLMLIVGVIYACYQILQNFVNDFACFFSVALLQEFKTLKSQKFHQPNKAKMLRSMLMSFLADLDFCPLTHRT